LSKKPIIVVLLALFFYLVFFYLVQPHPAFAQEDPQLYEIYNTIYDTSLLNNQELTDTYGVANDEIWLETNGWVEARARYAGYDQKFGYYTDLCLCLCLCIGIELSVPPEVLILI
jgi:hypothetical protein